MDSKCLYLKCGHMILKKRTINQIDIPVVNCKYFNLNDCLVAVIVLLLWVLIL